MSCKEMVVRVTMPETKFSTVKLDVNKNEFLVQSPKYLLGITLGATPSCYDARTTSPCHHPLPANDTVTVKHDHR